MAESLAIYFKSATWNELKRTLDSIGLPCDTGWYFPKDGEWCLTAYPYDDLFEEYEDRDLDRIFTILDDVHASILCIELRGSCGNRGCESAAELVVLLLEQFEGIVDDLVASCWTLEEIAKGVTKNGGKFLDCYRHGNGVPRSRGG